MQDAPQSNVQAVADFFGGPPSRVSVSEFQAFYRSRPEGEKWELLDGEVMQMMSPPSRVHQRIAKNVALALDRSIERNGLAWEADREIGVATPETADFNPEPDVVVVDRDITGDAYFADRFLVVAEVLSSSDTRDVLDRKTAFYQAHPQCVAILYVSQSEMSLALQTRGPDGWSTREINDPTAAISLPALDYVGDLADFYRHTPLADAGT